MKRFALASMFAVSLASVGASVCASASDAPVVSPSAVAVETTPESLMALNPYVFGDVAQEDRMREFLACFVQETNLPVKVWLDCGMAVAETGFKCSQGTPGDACLRSAIGLVQKCAVPVARSISAVQVCRNKSGEPDTPPAPEAFAPN